MRGIIGHSFPYSFSGQPTRSPFKLWHWGPIEGKVIDNSNWWFIGYNTSIKGKGYIVSYIHWFPWGRKTPWFWKSLGHKFQILGRISPLRLFGGPKGTSISLNIIRRSVRFETCLDTRKSMARLPLWPFSRFLIARLASGNLRNSADSYLSLLVLPYPIYL